MKDNRASRTTDGRRTVVDLGDTSIVNNIYSDMQMSLNSFFPHEVIFDGKASEEKGVSNIKGMKFIQDNSDDDFLYFKERFKEYALFKVCRASTGTVDVGEGELRDFAKSEIELAYISKTFLTDCGNGIWAVCEKSYKEILTQLWTAKHDQIRIIID